jgi:anti-sigma factor RsiW
MVHDRTDELIQMDIDGELSPAEKAELQAALAADAGARESVDSYRVLARQLDALPRTDAPPSLAGNVMRALRMRLRESGPPSPAPFAQRRRNILWAAYAAAAGLILGLLAGPALMRDAFRTVEPNRVSASVGLADVSSWKVVDRRSASTAEGGRVDLTVRRGAGDLAVEAAFIGSAGAEASISWDPSAASLIAFARSDASGSPIVEEGRLRAPIGGDATLTLILSARRMPGPIHLDVDGTRMLSSGSPAESTRE